MSAVKFVKENLTEGTVKEGTLIRQFPSKAVTKFMKERGISKEVLKELTKARRELIGAMIEVSGDELKSRKDIKAIKISTPTDIGMMRVTTSREREFKNPQTGDVIRKPAVAVTIRNKTLIPKEALISLEEKLSKM